MKRRQPESGQLSKSASPKKRRIADDNALGSTDQGFLKKKGVVNGVARTTTTQTSPRRTPKGSKARVEEGSEVVDSEENDLDSPTPKPNKTILFTTPRKLNGTPARLRKADRSAHRKSTQILLEGKDGQEWEGDTALAREILGDGTDGLVGDDVFDPEAVDDATSTMAETNGTVDAETPSKRGRGRPKGAKNKRSPTPEGDIPPEERYFFQNRSGPPQISSNTLTSLKLLTHEEYFDQMRVYEEDHLLEKAYLMRLHTRSFPQWQFELDEGFNVCLYGWGSKRHLSHKFAEWLHGRPKPPPKIVVVNGYTPKLNIRSVLNTLASAVMGDALPPRLVGQPHEVVDTILSYMSKQPPIRPIVIIVNSIDAPNLRRASTQHIFAQIAADSSIQLIATADTPTVALMWNSTFQNLFNFLFHDCTTYASYHAELSVVDDVNELLGRKGRRIGGREGVGFVLQSLPENARNLYRVLITEVLSVLSNGIDDVAEDTLNGERAPTRKPMQDTEEIGIEYRALYQKASEEFICSSDMNFRFLLKEFHDHQMVTSRRDASGTELLGVPLVKEEMEGVLEDLVLG